MRVYRLDAAAQPTATVLLGYGTLFDVRRKFAHLSSLGFSVNEYEVAYDGFLKAYGHMAFRPDRATLIATHPLAT